MSGATMHAIERRRYGTPDMLALNELIEAGKIQPVIDRRYALRDTADALRYVGEGRAQGQTVIQV